MLNMFAAKKLTATGQENAIIIVVGNRKTDLIENCSTRKSALIVKNIEAYSVIFAI